MNSNAVLFGMVFVGSLIVVVSEVILRKKALNQWDPEEVEVGEIRNLLHLFENRIDDDWWNQAITRKKNRWIRSVDQVRI